MALSGATIPGQSGPGSNNNEGVLCIPQSSSITGTSPSDCLVSYPGLSLGGGLTPLLSVYFTAPANWANRCVCMFEFQWDCFIHFWTNTLGKGLS